MNALLIAKAYLKEVFSRNIIQRVPEPRLIMSLKEQAQAYALGAGPEGSLAPMHFYILKEATKTIVGAKKVLDLGVGTGHVFCKLAQINPDIQFYGVDLSNEMLAIAREQAEEMQLKNVHFIVADMTKLDFLQQDDFDAVISSLAIHHLPDIFSLQNLFLQVAKLFKNKKPKIYFFDLGRVKNESTIKATLQMHPTTPFLYEDGYNSLKASFTNDEFKEACRNANLLQLVHRSTFLVPYLIEVRTEGHQLNSVQKNALSKILKNLSSQNKNFVKLINFLMCRT